MNTAKANVSADAITTDMFRKRVAFKRHLFPVSAYAALQSVFAAQGSSKNFLKWNKKVCLSYPSHKKAEGTRAWADG